LIFNDSFRGHDCEKKDAVLKCSYADNTLTSFQRSQEPAYNEGWKELDESIHEANQANAEEFSTKLSPKRPHNWVPQNFG
jgi:hypothetical protein